MARRGISFSPPSRPFLLPAGQGESHAVLSYSVQVKATYRNTRPACCHNTICDNWGAATLDRWPLWAVRLLARTRHDQVQDKQRQRPAVCFATFKVLALGLFLGACQNSAQRLTQGECLSLSTYPKPACTAAPPFLTCWLVHHTPASVSFFSNIPGSSSKSKPSLRARPT